MRNENARLHKQLWSASRIVERENIAMWANKELLTTGKKVCNGALALYKNICILLFKCRNKTDCSVFLLCIMLKKTSRVFIDFLYIYCHTVTPSGSLLWLCQLMDHNNLYRITAYLLGMSICIHSRSIKAVNTILSGAEVNTSEHKCVVISACVSHV